MKVCSSSISLTSLKVAEPIDDKDIESQGLVEVEVEREDSTSCRKVFQIFLCTIAIVPMFFLELLLIITFFFHSGNLRGVAGWHINAMLSILCVLCFVLGVMFLFRLSMRKDLSASYLRTRRKSILAVFTYWAVALFLLSEIGFGVVVPSASILPLNTFDNHDALKTSTNLPKSCTQSQIYDRWESVKEYYNESQVDFSEVRLVTGGMPGHFNTASAMVIDQTIYIKKNSCPSVALLVHEVVHIWQFQTSWWFGSNGPSRYFDWQISQMKCRSCPYDYGGEEGLTELIDQDKTDIRDLGCEQQASIVEDYYLSSSPSSGSLHFFALQVLFTP